MSQAAFNFQEPHPFAVVGLPEWYEDKAPRMEPTETLMLMPARELDVPTVELANAYTRLFDYFNEELFVKVLGEPLPHPVLNFSRSKGKGTAAFFSPNSWKDPMTGDMLDEISIVPEWTSQEPTEVLSTLVHEMVHQRDHLNGTSCKNGYHGLHWFKMMERLGLPGRARNAAKIKVTHDVDPDGEFMKSFKRMPKDLLLPFTTSRSREAFFIGPVKKETLQGKRAKYQCPMCAVERNGGGIMRGPTGMSLHCKTHDEEIIEIGF